MTLRRAWAVAGLVLALATPLRADEVSVSQAREIGISALAQGQIDLAEQVARGLLQRDRDDAFAHLLLARVQEARGDARGTRRQLRLAYRTADRPDHKFQAAQLAARKAVEEDRLTSAQLWLRRSLTFAPTAMHERVVIRDYRILRAKNPLNLSFDMTVAPSSNVNGGADSAVSTIDGLPFVGAISPSGQALSGTVATADARLRYRLSGNQVARTDATFRLGTRHVVLSNAARAAAPGVSGSDYSSVTGEVGLSHLRRIGDGSVKTEAALSRSWQKGRALQDGVRVGLTYGREITEALSWQGGVTREWRDYLLSATQDQQLWTLRTTLGYDLRSGSDLSFTLLWRGADSAAANKRSDRWMAYAAFRPDKPIGPADVTLRLGAAREDFPDYMVGFFAVPGGRQDETWFANIDMVFKDFDYGGFAPSVTVSAQGNTSNVSHFSSQEMAISLGIRSTF